MEIKRQIEIEEPVHSKTNNELSDSALSFWTKLTAQGTAKESGYSNSKNQPIFEYIGTK